jgi:hypothetical protein
MSTSTFTSYNPDVLSQEQSPLLKTRDRDSLAALKYLPADVEVPPLRHRNLANETKCQSSQSPTTFERYFRPISPHWFPDRYEEEPDDETNNDKHNQAAVSSSRTTCRVTRSMRRRFFLLLTEPGSSIGSTIFFIVLITSILIMNVVMIMQTMKQFQYTPSDCRSCGGSVSYLFDDDTSIEVQEHHRNDFCLCPPSPYPWTATVTKYLIYFFTVEWTIRIVFYTTPHISEDSTDRNGASVGNSFKQWLSYVFSMPMVLDALAIFPYYVEMTGYRTNGLVSLRLLRLLRVFQLVRLGQYNQTFQSLTTVLSQSVVYLELLIGIICFGAALFGSLLYWIEKGDWQYYPPTNTYEFVRYDHTGQLEISPFTSIPATFWWWVVTATTVCFFTY